MRYRKNQALKSMPTSELVARLKDDANYLYSGHAPRSSEAAKELGEELNELLLRVQTEITR